jgi:opacity protein-like surface antigen
LLANCNGEGTEMKKHLGILAVSAFVALPSHAAETDGLFRSSDLEWFGNLSATYMDSNGEINFYGNTASVYGGAPSISMDDGQGLSFAVGFQTRDGWRLSAELGQMSLNSSTSDVFGLNDRINDTFRVDAEIESLVFMLNGGYDFEIGSERFTPFFEGGVGVARNESRHAILDVSYDSLIWNGSSLDDQQLIGYSYPNGETTEFAWSASVGLRMALSERFDLSLSYGLMDLGEALTETDDGGDALGFDDLSSQQWQLGLEFEF